MDTTPDIPRRLIRLALVLSVALGLVATAGLSEADAQKKPLKMTFVDGTPDTSAAIYAKLRDIISGSNDIAFTKPGQYLATADSYGVNRGVLGHAGKRVSQKDRIRKSMRAQNLESVVLYKRTESKIHLIVIGPRGNELRHFRSPIKAETINDEQAVGVLKQIFEVLVPEVIDYRENNPEANKGPTETAGDGSDSGRSDDPIRNEAVEDHKNAHANLEPGVTVALSPIFGRRSLSISTEGGFELGHSTPYLGVGGRVDAIFGLLDAETAAIGGSIYANFAPFSTTFQGTEGGQQSYNATFFRGGLAFQYLAGLTETLILFGQVGGEGTNIGIQSNPTYVGSTYGAVNAGLGLINRFEGVADLRIYAGALPTVLTNTNDGAFGPGGFSFGFNANARFTLRIWEPFRVGAFYDLQLMTPHHPTPRDHETVANGTDVIHMGGLSAEYHF